MGFPSYVYLIMLLTLANLCLRSLDGCPLNLVTTIRLTLGKDVLHSCRHKIDPTRNSAGCSSERCLVFSNQVLSREEPVSSASSHRSNGLALDGSYLGFATTGPPHGPRVRQRHGGQERAPADDKPTSRSSVELSPENRPMRRQKCEARGPHPEFHHSCHHCRCQGGRYGAQQLRCDEGPHRRSRPRDELDQDGCER